MDHQPSRIVGRHVQSLKLADFKKIKERSSEESFERIFVLALHECGYESWHMSCRDKGWPDRYVRGGIWIEMKSLKRLGKDTQLSTQQRGKLASLSGAGDRCFYLAKWEDSVIFLPWAVAKTVTDLKTVERFRYRTKEDLKEMIRHVLG